MLRLLGLLWILALLVGASGCGDKEKAIPTRELPTERIPPKPDGTSMTVREAQLGQLSSSDWQ